MCANYLQRFDRGRSNYHRNTQFVRIGRAATRVDQDPSDNVAPRFCLIRFGSAAPLATVNSHCRARRVPPHSTSETLGVFFEFRQTVMVGH
jgi:hypothetical protein